MNPPEPRKGELPAAPAGTEVQNEGSKREENNEKSRNTGLERFVMADFSLRAKSFLPENYGHRRGRKGPTVTAIWEPRDSGIESF